MEPLSTLVNQKDNGEMLHPPLNFRIARTIPYHDPVEEVGADVTLRKLKEGAEGSHARVNGPIENNFCCP